MKAILFESYGSPDVLELKEADKPTPTANEVLVKVHAAGTNPLDWHKMRGAPVLVRLTDGLLKPKDNRLGADVAGTVEAVGSEVSSFKIGDTVFGERGVGGFAEYVCVPEKLLAHKPDNLTFAEAAAVPVAALTALQALRDSGNIQAGQAVLINGASGGVGTFMVQLAKHFGAEVTAVCSTRNIELVQKLGAAHIIDYTKEKVVGNGRQYDVVQDNVGNLKASDFRRLLKPQGVGVMVGFTTIRRMLGNVLAGRWSAFRGGPTISPMLAHPNKEDMELLHELLARNVLKPIIDRCYPLAETAEAIRYLETSRARGKVVILMEETR
ncbi:NAD(P)-dependent alcohol dehydrogenase [Candidatus Leptofilum sp.]|uniref:NAD(P)-dependent alcohol dehydrogenase n=1 Tax=Candidatus Leptofilum sp. TaxID=3241576 RepID=UPI003B5BBB90